MQKGAAEPERWVRWGRRGLAALAVLPLTACASPVTGSVGLAVVEFSPLDSSPETDLTNAVAWADFDGDGDLDLAAANSGAPNRLYLNDGTGTLFDSPPAWSSPEAEDTRDLA